MVGSVGKLSRRAASPRAPSATARADVERNASLQLEVVRGELAQAEAEIARLKSEMEMGSKGGRRGAAPAPAPAPAVVAAPPSQQLSAPAQPEERVVTARRPRAATGS